MWISGVGGDEGAGRICGAVRSGPDTQLKPPLQYLSIFSLPPCSIQSEGLFLPMMDGGRGEKFVLK